MHGLKLVLYVIPVLVTILGWIVLSTIIDSHINKDKDKDNK
jgi:hypothetical protein